MLAFISDRQQILIEYRFLCIKRSVPGMMVASHSNDIAVRRFGFHGLPPIAQRRTN